ncbi:MAG: hypothetical protein KBB55_00685 [Candidatus Buchananbacteria bacterium]|nr:hypothetical protein [Candidatus Buchananbacteria bacterium]
MELLSTFPVRGRMTVKNVLELLQCGAGAGKVPALFTDRVNHLPPILSLVHRQSGVTTALQVFKVIDQDVELSAELQAAISALDHIALLDEKRALLAAATGVLGEYPDGINTVPEINRVISQLKLKRDQLLTAWSEDHLPKLKEHLPKGEVLLMQDVA